FRGQLFRAAPPELVGGRRPDSVVDLARDVAEDHRLAGRADLRAPVITRLRDPVEGLVLEIDGLGREDFGLAEAQPDDRERAEAELLRGVARRGRHAITK